MISKRDHQYFLQCGGYGGRQTNAIISAGQQQVWSDRGRAEALGDTYRLIADDGRNLTLSNLRVRFPRGIGQTGIVYPDTTQSSITLQSAGQIELIPSPGTLSEAGFEVGTYGANKRGQLVEDMTSPLWMERCSLWTRWTTR